MKDLKLKLRKSVLLKKGLVTFLIMIVYSLGRNIPLPYLKITTSGKIGELFQATSVATGGDFASNSIFSLGLSPWMTAVIVMSLFTMSRKSTFSGKSDREQSFWQMLLTLIFSFLQGIVKIFGLNFVSLGLQEKMAVLTVMIGATFFLVWLASMNAQFGIGGASAIFIVNIVIGNARMITPGFRLLSKHKQWFVWGIILGLFVIMLIIIIAVIFERSEYRMPLKRIMITNSYSDEVYLPIKAASAGAMPIMFSMSLVTLPQYLFKILATVWPHNLVLTWIANHFSITNVVGVIVYLIALFGLSLGFTYVNVNPDDFADDLQKSGDYLTGIAYGEETKGYIKRHMWAMGTIGGLYLTFFAGAPLFLGVLYPELRRLVLLPGNLMLNTTFILVIIDQIRTLRLANNYSKIL